MALLKPSSISVQWPEHSVEVQIQPSITALVHNPRRHLRSGVRVRNLLTTQKQTQNHLCIATSSCMPHYTHLILGTDLSTKDEVK